MMCGDSVTDNCLADFPHLDETELRNITCGVYQLKLNSSYMQEYLEGNSEIFVKYSQNDR
jgi:hypothetical protein